MNYTANPNEKTNTQFSKEVTNLLLQGGQVIHHFTTTTTPIRYILIRMPKGKWIPFMHKGQENNFFYEFVYAGTYHYNLNEYEVMGWRNGHVRTVRNEIHELFRESCYLFRVTNVTK